MKNPLFEADDPYEHIGRYGSRIFADRCDLKNGIVVARSQDVSIEHVMVDVIESMTYHAFAIWPHLNGFPGYDCIKVTIDEIIEPDEETDILEKVMIMPGLSDPDCAKAAEAALTDRNHLDYQALLLLEKCLNVVSPDSSIYKEGMEIITQRSRANEKFVNAIAGKK